MYDSFGFFRMSLPDDVIVRVLNSCEGKEGKEYVGKLSDIPTHLNDLEVVACNRCKDGSYLIDLL